MLSIKLLETNKQIEEKILDALAFEVNKKIKKLADDISELIGPFILEQFKNTDTYRSLISGDLKIEFGFYDEFEYMYVDPILQKITDTIGVSYKTVSKKSWKGSLKIYILNDDLNLILNHERASYISKTSGKDIDWLEWLLLRGDSYIIADYNVLYGAGVGRSQGGIMVQSSRPWRVLPEYAGTQYDNWLTRTLDAYGQFIADHIGKVIEENI